MKRLLSILKRRRLDAAVLFDEYNIRALTGVTCDSACLLATADGTVRMLTDFRYAPMVRRVAPGLKLGDFRRAGGLLAAAKPKRVGFEGSLAQSRFAALGKHVPRATFVDVTREMQSLRAVKGSDEIAALRRAVALNDAIWSEASARFAAGMTEREMARIIRHLMVEKGDGEAFGTIVCVGANAAECHHEPDDTVWNGRDPVLVDMGVKRDGYCSDMTRNLKPRRRSPRYDAVYGLVLEANNAAIAAARPGMTGRALDAVARRIIRKAGYGKAFGHSLGHGVGLEIHEAPNASRTSDWVLKPGMLVTIEPGVYLEGELGVRIEDLVLITENGCEVLTRSAK